MLKDLGAFVKWDQETKSVDVKLPNDIKSIAKEVSKYNVDYVYALADGTGTNYIVYEYKGKIADIPNGAFTSSY